MSAEIEENAPPRLPTKIVIVLASGLRPAEAANAAAVLALSAGIGTETFGAEGTDADGVRYGKIDRHPIPVLEADQSSLRALHQRVADDPASLRVVAFTEVARRARDYDAYLADLRSTASIDNAYVGLLIVGPRNRVSSLTKRLALYGE